MKAPLPVPLETEYLLSLGHSLHTVIIVMIIIYKILICYMTGKEGLSEPLLGGLFEGIFDGYQSVTKKMDGI